MSTDIIKNNDGSYISATTGGNVEFVNPIDHYSSIQVNSDIQNQMLMWTLANPNNNNLNDQMPGFISSAYKKWEKYYDEIMKTKVPNQLIDLLSSTRKNEQEKLIRNLEFSVYQFAHFWFTAYSDFDFTFSSYVFEGLPNNTTLSELPKLFFIKEEELVISGNTVLKPGILKNLIRQRTVHIVKILDRGSDWHCFFTTDRSLGREEKWGNGQPHYHYISDKWGIKREDLLSRFEALDYISSSIHIRLTDYR